MEISKETWLVGKGVMYGVVGGGVLLAIVGFRAGGWYTSGQATAFAAKTADIAVVKALTPICVATFMSQPDSAAQLVALKAAPGYGGPGEIVRKHVKIPGLDSIDYTLGDMCGDALSHVAAKTAEK